MRPAYTGVFSGYCGGGGVYDCGCCAVIESLAKCSSNFVSISDIFASAHVARSAYLVTALVSEYSSVFVSVACIAIPNSFPIVVPSPSVILSSYSLIMCLRKMAHLFLLFGRTLFHRSMAFAYIPPHLESLMSAYPIRFGSESWRSTSRLERRKIRNSSILCNITSIR